MIAFNFFSALAGWITCIVSADLAVILSASVFAGKKASGIIAFIIFIILTTLLGMGMDMLPELNSIELNLALDIAVSFLAAAIFYLISGWIMDKKLSV